MASGAAANLCGCHRPNAPRSDAQRGSPSRPQAQSGFRLCACGERCKRSEQSEGNEQAKAREDGREDTPFIDLGLRGEASGAPRALDNAKLPNVPTSEVTEGVARANEWRRHGGTRARRRHVAANERSDGLPTNASNEQARHGMRDHGARKKEAACKSRPLSPNCHGQTRPAEGGNRGKEGVKREETSTAVSGCADPTEGCEGTARAIPKNKQGWTQRQNKLRQARKASNEQAKNAATKHFYGRKGAAPDCEVAGERLAVTAAPNPSKRTKPTPPFYGGERCGRYKKRIIKTYKQRASNEQATRFGGKTVRWDPPHTQARHGMRDHGAHKYGAMCMN